MVGAEPVRKNGRKDSGGIEMVDVPLKHDGVV